MQALSFQILLKFLKSSKNSQSYGKISKIIKSVVEVNFVVEVKTPALTRQHIVQMEWHGVTLGNISAIHTKIERRGGLKNDYAFYFAGATPSAFRKKKRRESSGVLRVRKCF